MLFTDYFYKIRLVISIIQKVITYRLRLYLNANSINL